jgi:hypothetical protein
MLTAPRDLGVILTVVVPVRDNAATLPAVLLSIRASALPSDRYRLIVVDDSSADSSATIAARHADTVIRLTPRHSGPAYARNRGADLADTQYVAFVNPDVLLPPNALPEILAKLEESKDIAAISASTDVRSEAGNFASDYWNLLIGFGEHRHPFNCVHLDSDCVVVRRSALIATGMYDEWRFRKGGLEGLELGQRLESSGHRLLKVHGLGLSSVRRWSLVAVCREVWRRSSLLARTFGYQRTSTCAPGEVVITLSRALMPAMAVIGSASLAASFAPQSFLVPRNLGVLALILLGNLPVHRFYARKRGLGFALASAPVHAVVQGIAAVALCVGWVLRASIGDSLPDATTQAFAEVGLEIWPPIPRKI